MITVKARIPQQIDFSPILPITVPDLDEVNVFAASLHGAGKYWKGEVFGWPAEYTPERKKAPIDSNMTFTPAEFWIGQSGIWFYSLMWERGKSQPPAEFLDDRGIVERG